MRVLRAADRIATAWKNGGGVTREVAIWPPNSTFDDFDWRVSIAEVRSAGPFSVFENIDRIMLILKGRIALDFAERSVELDSQSAPFAFAGDIACHGRPLDGAVMDLNVMTRRGRCTAKVESLAHAQTEASGPGVLIIATQASLIEIGTERVTLGTFDALALGGDIAVRLHSGAGFLIAFTTV